jgi:ATP-dependent protease ClpP protease subunit
MREKVDWWMDAEEAVFYGFADGVLGQEGFENLDKIRVKRKLK